MTKYVQITGAKKPTYWYADKVGEVFEVSDETEEFYGVKHYAVAGEYERMITVTDAEETEKPTQLQTAALTELVANLALELIRTRRELQAQIKANAEDIRTWTQEFENYKREQALMLTRLAVEYDELFDEQDAMNEQINEDIANMDERLIEVEGGGQALDVEKVAEIVAKRNAVKVTQNFGGDFDATIAQQINAAYAEGGSR